MASGVLLERSTQVRSHLTASQILGNPWVLIHC